MTAGNSKETEDTKKMPVGRRFQPGQSGNPSGRPKQTPEELDLIAAAKKKAPEVMRVLSKILKEGSERGKLRAAELILERGYGKAPAFLGIDARIGVKVDVMQLSDDELMKIAAGDLASLSDEALERLVDPQDANFHR